MPQDDTAGAAGRTGGGADSGAAGESSGDRRAPMPLLVNMLVNVLLPYASYRLLTGYDFATLDALVIAAVFPVGLAAVELVLHRRLDLLTVLSVLVLALGMVASQLTVTPRLALSRESLFSGAFAVILLGSLLLPRPLAFYLCRTFAARHEPALDQLWFRRWRACPTLRRSLRVLTALWGVLLLGDAVGRVVVAHTMPIPRATSASHMGSFLVLALLVAFSIGYLRRTLPSIRREFAELAGGAPAGGTREA